MEQNAILSLLAAALSGGNTTSSKPVTGTAFDFASYNKLMTGSPGGLKIFLSLQNMQNIAEMLVRVKSPLANDAKAIVELLADFRTKYREAAATRVKQGPAPRAEYDNASQTDQEMFKQFQRFVEFSKAGNQIGAHTADQGITEAQQASQLPE